MLQIVFGNIFQSHAEAVVNTVNCVGVMGKGLALQFKKEFPENFVAYVDACRRHAVVPGKMFVYRTGMLLPQYVINFPTKRHWRDKSRLEDIESGLTALVDVIRHYGIRSIAIPPLGCGLGGLDWRVVRQCIETAMADVPDVRVLLYEPT